MTSSSVWRVSLFCASCDLVDSSSVTIYTLAKLHTNYLYSHTLCPVFYDRVFQVTTFGGSSANTLCKFKKDVIHRLYTLFRVPCCYRVRFTCQKSSERRGLLRRSAGTWELHTCGRGASAQWDMRRRLAGIHICYGSSLAIDSEAC